MRSGRWYGVVRATLPPRADAQRDYRRRDVGVLQADRDGGGQAASFTLEVYRLGLSTIVRAVADRADGVAPRMPARWAGPNPRARVRNIERTASALSDNADRGIGL